MDLIIENSFYSTEQEKLDFLANREVLITSFYVNVFGTLGLYKMDSKKTRMLQYYIGDKRLQLRSINDENNDTSLIVKLMVDEGLLRTQVANKITRFLVIMKRRPDASTIDEELIREWLKESRFNVNRPAMRLLPAIRKFTDGEYTLSQLAVAMWNFLRRNKDFAAYNKEFMNIAVQYRQLMNKVVKADAEDSENAEVGVTQADGSVIKVGSPRKINEPLVQKRKHATDVKLNEVDIREVFNTLFLSFDHDKVTKLKMLDHLSTKGGLLFDGYQDHEIDTILKDYFDYDKLYTIIKDRFDINNLYSYINTVGFSVYSDRNKALFSSLAITTLHEYDKRFEDFRNQVLARYVTSFIIKVTDDADGFYNVIASEYKQIQTRELDNLIAKEVGVLSDIQDILDDIKQTFTLNTLLQIPDNLKGARLYDLTKILETVSLDKAIINYFEPISNRTDIELLYMYCCYKNAFTTKKIDNSYLATVFANHNLKFSDNNIYTPGINNHPEFIQTLLNNKDTLYYSKNLVVDDYTPNSDLHPALWHFLNFKNTESNQDKELFLELEKYLHDQVETNYTAKYFDGFIESLEKNYDKLSNTDKNKLFMISVAAFSYFILSYRHIPHKEIFEYIKFFEEKFDVMDSNNTNFFNKVSEYQSYIMETTDFVKWKTEILEKHILDFNPMWLIEYKTKIKRDTIERYGIDKYFEHAITEKSINDLSYIYNAAVKFVLNYDHEELPKFWSKVLDTKYVRAINLIQSTSFLNWVSNNKFKSGTAFFEYLTNNGTTDIVKVIRILARVPENYNAIYDVDDFVSNSKIKYNMFDFDVITDESVIDSLITLYLDYPYVPILNNILGCILPNYKQLAHDKLETGLSSFNKHYNNIITRMDDERLDKILTYLESNDIDLLNYVTKNHIDPVLNNIGLRRTINFHGDNGNLYDVMAKRVIKLLDFSSYKNDTTKSVEILNNFIEKAPSKHKTLELNRIMDDTNLNDQIKSEFYNQLKLGPRRSIAQKLYSKSYFEKTYKQLIGESAVIKPYKMPEDINKYLKLNNIVDDGIKDNDIVISKNDIKSSDIRTYDDLQSFTDPDNIQNLLLEPLAVEPIDESEEELELKTVEYDVFNRYAHGDAFGVKFLRSFNVDIPIQREQNKLWAKELEVEGKSSEVMERVFHGTGSIGASFILRSGFAVSDDLVKAGRMLGDGIYFTNVLDKASLYVGDDSYLRRPGNVTGYILEMKVSLGEKGVDYNDGGDRRLISPEWVCYRPNYQCTIYKAHEVELVSKSELDKLKTKHRINEGFIHMKNFSEYITERAERAKLRSEPNRKGMVYTFKDEYIPTLKGLVHYTKWRSPNRDIVLSSSAWGPAITIYNDTQSGVLAVLDSREFENSSEGKEFINLAYRR